MDGYLKDMKMPRLRYAEPFLNQSTKKKDFLLRLKEKLKNYGTKSMFKKYWAKAYDMVWITL